MLITPTAVFVIIRIMPMLVQLPPTTIISAARNKMSSWPSYSVLIMHCQHSALVCVICHHQSTYAAHSHWPPVMIMTKFNRIKSCQTHLLALLLSRCPNNLKILIGAVALGVSTLGRDEWEQAQGNHEHLAKRMTMHTASLTTKPVSFIASEGFSSKHGNMLRLLEALMHLPGSKWKMQENKHSIRLNKLADMSKFLQHVRMTAKTSFQCIAQTR